MAFHYIRSLLYQDAIELYQDSSQQSSIIALASASKDIIQLLQLLDERHFSFSICLNRDHVLSTAGLATFLRDMKIGSGSRTTQESHQTIDYITSELKRRKSAHSRVFLNLAQRLHNNYPRSRHPKIGGKSKKSKSTSNLASAGRFHQVRPHAPQDGFSSLAPHRALVGESADDTGLFGKYDPHILAESPGKLCSMSTSELNETTCHQLPPTSTNASTDSIKEQVPNLDFLSFDHQELPDLHFDLCGSDSLRSSSESERITDYSMLSDPLKLQYGSNTSRKPKHTDGLARVEQAWSQSPWQPLITEDCNQYGFQELWPTPSEGA